MIGCGGGETTIDCEVAIIGGGAGGMHTAYRLGPTLGKQVCVFEKEAELGGRIHDVPMDPNDPNSPRMGTGARRVMEGQKVLFGLATELGLMLDKPPLDTDLIDARGKWSFSKDDFVPLYPKIKLKTNPQKDQETWLYDLLRMGPERANAAKYADFRAYIRAVAGEDSYQFLLDMSRFRADFTYPLDARGYLDYLDEEWDVCCQPSYPVGGMSAFIRGMQAKATDAGVRIFTGEPVLDLSKDGTQYKLKTSKQTVRAQKVVISAPPSGFDKVTGDIADKLHMQPQYQALIGVKVATISQWWPDSWWLNIKDPTKMMDAQVWRAWTTDHCLNFIEIPVEPYAAAQHVTRSVYVDDLDCVNFWEALAKSGIANVEAEIGRGLQFLFNNNMASTPMTVVIPTPKRTQIQIWDAAWYWLKASSGFTNAAITDWAVEPLSGENVYMVGEAYNPQRSGWSDAAYKSSIKLLAAKFGITVPMALTVRDEPRRMSRSDGGH